MSLMGILNLQIWSFENSLSVPLQYNRHGPIQQLVQSEPVVSAPVYESMEGARDQHDKHLTFV